MSQSHDSYSPQERNSTGISTDLLNKCQDDFDQFLGKFRYIEDLIGTVSESESLCSESLFGDLYDIAVNKYGSDEDGLEFPGATFVDGAVLALSAADVFAANMGIDPAIYRIKFRQLAQSGIEDDVLAANFELHIQVHEIFQPAYEVISEIILNSTTEDTDSFRDGFESTLSVAIQSIVQARAEVDLAPVAATLESEELLDKSLKEFTTAEAKRSAPSEISEYPELIPEEFSRLFNPLAEVDNALIRDYMIGRIFSGESVVREIQYLHKFHTLARGPLVERLINIGKYIEPCDEELKYTDVELTRMNAFNSGMTIALSAIDMISVETRGTRSEWGVEWAECSPNFDLPDVLFEKKPETSTEYAEVGRKIIEIGNKLWDQLPVELQEMVEAIDGQLVGASTHVNIFHASFAYIFFFGREVLARVVLEEREDEYIKNMMPSDEYFEDERKFFIQS